MTTQPLVRVAAHAALLSFCALTLESSFAAQQSVPGPGNSPTFVAGDVVVRFRPGIAPTSRTSALLRIVAVVRRHFAQLDIDHVRLPQGVDVDAAIRILRADPELLSAEPTYLRRIVGQ